MMPIVGGFPRPDWEAIGLMYEAGTEEQRQEGWETWARTWVNATTERLPDGYRVEESDNFLIMSAQDGRYVELLSKFLERALKKIMSNLGGIALDEGYGKHVVLIFNEQEPYYQYMSYFFPEEGEFILSSGVFLNSEYGHFAFPFLEMASAEPTSAHELTHACLRHLPIPLWLNEGFAVTMEDEICGFQPLQMEPERFREHRAFWNAETIQEFWSGFSFNRTDKGSGLSYELARFCLRSLAHDYDAFALFANTANFEDGGERAAIEVFGGSLGGVIHQFFGDGDWSPRPGEWSAQGV
ncbi:MAG: hypothetical protein ACR2QZ_03190 [Woeseiaceae bacterium]